MEGPSIFVGPVVHSVERENVTVIPKAAVVVASNKILAVETVESAEHLEGLVNKYSPFSVVTLREGQILIPGFIDTHLHAPQFPNAGLGYDKTLLEWLSTYTFPLENEYEDEEKARQIYTDVVQTTLKYGTTTAVYFGTTHVESSVILAQKVCEKGQRALVGKVCMDANVAPEFMENTGQSIKDTEKFIKRIFDMQNDRVRPIVTPRFAITCSESLLGGLSTLASDHNIHIQTHLSETKDEIEEVKKLFPKAANYAAVYGDKKLLTRKTILAHCVHLEDAEIALLKDKGCSVAHCPNSNLCLRSGLCDVRRLLNAGVNVSLGTDVAGGSNLMMLDAIRSCINTSIAVSFQTPTSTPLSYHEAFYLATMGGAIALDMDDKLGNFEPGKYFDALIIDTGKSPMRTDSELTVGELFQKFIYTGDDRNIIQTYVNGRSVEKSTN